MLYTALSYAKDLYYGGFTLQALGKKVFFDLLQNVQDGYLEVALPNNKSHFFGQPKSKIQGKIIVVDEAFFGRLVTNGDLGFAEAFIQGEIQVPDLTQVFKILVQNRENMSNLDSRFAWFGHLMDKAVHWRNSNTLTQAQENVSAHYDLSNEMFATFLDNTMTYSCAYFKNEEETLEQAQINKIRLMIEKAKLKPEHHLLEIGSGWGALAMEAVRMTGCRVTSLTLSKEQKALADARIAAAGLSDRIEIKICDYRLMEGTFDRIISVEMLEQVGHEFLGTFFKTCENLLKPNGIAVIQVITMPESRYEAYLKGCDFIQKYIFPGGHCPSVNAMVAAMTQSTSLTLEHLENIGPHYAKTLRLWCENFKNNSKKLAQMGFDERFQRIWEYYLCYCEAGFATRSIGDVQIVITRPNNLDLSEGVPE